MDSKTITKAVITTHEGLIKQDLPDDLINLMFDFVGNVWEEIQPDQSEYMFRINIINKSTSTTSSNWFHNQYYCPVCCKVSSKKDTTFSNHFNTKTHLKELKKYKNNKTEQELIQEIYNHLSKWKPEPYTLSKVKLNHSTICTSKNIVNVSNA